MKYPLDGTTFSETLLRISEHNKMQNLIIDKMSNLLMDAMNDTDEEPEWAKESEQLIKDLHSLRMWHESRRFNENNLHQQYGTKEGAPVLDEEEQLSEIGEMGEEDLAKFFREKKEKKVKIKTLSEMSVEEIKSWEKAQDNSNDIYKVAARVKNLARGPGMSLTPQGEMLCNSFVHVLKAIYDFAETIPDANTKIQLIELTRKQEGMPGTLIGAAGAGVTKTKDKNEPKT